MTAWSLLVKREFSATHMDLGKGGKVMLINDWQTFSQWLSIKVYLNIDSFYSQSEVPM